MRLHLIAAFGHHAELLFRCENCPAVLPETQLLRAGSRQLCESCYALRPGASWAQPRYFTHARFCGCYPSVGGKRVRNKHRPWIAGPDALDLHATSQHPKPNRDETASAS